ncbi:MAG: carbohydrate ABC transporter permease [Acidimicrobiia bacterium]
MTEATAGTYVAAEAPGYRRDRWRPIKKSLAYAVLIGFALLFIMPFLLALVTSFKTPPDFTRNAAQPWWDGSLGSPTLAGIELLNSPSIRIPRWGFVSVVTSVSVTLGRVFLASLGGYALARLRFPGRRLIFAMVLAVLMIPGVVLLVPKFIIMKELHILNTWFGLTLPITFDYAFGLFLMKQFFEGLPREMEESASIDGASTFQTFWRVMLPLAAPGLIALTILSFQGSWNEFLHMLIAAPAEPDLRTLPVGLALLGGQFGQAQPQHAMMAASLITTIPMAVIFFTFQRYFIQGVAASGLKG